MSHSVQVVLQVKVDPYDRTDTKKPNNSPVVLVKPYYRWVLFVKSSFWIMIFMLYRYHNECNMKDVLVSRT